MAAKTLRELIGDAHCASLFNYLKKTENVTVRQKDCGDSDTPINMVGSFHENESATEWIFELTTYESEEIAMLNIAKAVAHARHYREMLTSDIDLICITASYGYIWHEALKWLKMNTLFGLSYDFSKHSRGYQFIKEDLAEWQKSPSNELNNL